MATNPKLKAALLSRLDVTPQRLSQLVNKTKRQSPMSTEEATYVIAFQKGLDLTKYLDPPVVDRVRSLIPATSAQQVHLVNTKQTKKIPKRPQRINIHGVLPDVDAFLSSTIAKDAQDMAQLYPVYYVLENSLRIVIGRIMKAKYGDNWWDTKVSRRTKIKVADRKNKEDDTPWHGKRGQHEIFYSDFGDLRAIVEKNWDDDFKDVFTDRAWIVQRLNELEHPRNILAHHNPVGSTDLKRIELYFNEWITLLNSRKELIP